MKLLVIGSKGFIGQHVQLFLKSKQSYNVFGCDVVADYSDSDYFLIDATNSDFNEIFSSKKFDTCINCSGAAVVADSVANPLRDYQLNTVNVFKILDAIRKYNPACRFLNLSSAAVYGNPLKLPVSEDAPLLPVSPYGWHKLYAEQACAEFYKMYSVKTCSLRIFSAYGSGLQKQLFWDLYKKSLDAQQVELFGTGMESRDFIHIDDISRVIELVIEKGSFEADVYNVANGEEICIKDAVRQFYECLNWKGNYSFKGETRKGDPNNWVADITKIRELGYACSVRMNDGLKKYVSWLSESASD